MMSLTAEEARVVGALAEKQLATPQYYPLTLNALVNACNQSNNRDPVVSYSEDTVLETFAALREKGIGRIVHPGSGSRVTKYRQVLDEALGLDTKELALVCVMLLRGPQTLNELRTRTERMADFDDADDVRRDLERLADRDESLVVRLERQAGQREERFATTLVPLSEQANASARPATPSRGAAAPTSAAHRPALLDTPRVDPLPVADMTEASRELFALTGPPRDHNLFQTVARDPELFAAWLPFLGKLLQGGRLRARHRELAVLRTSYLVGSAYQWGHHVNFAIEHEVLTDDEVEGVATGPEAFEGVEALVVRSCDEVHAAGLVSDTTWAGLEADLDEQSLIELLFLIGQYRMGAVVIASLGVQPEPGLPPMPTA